MITNKIYYAVLTGVILFVLSESGVIYRFIYFPMPLIYIYNASLGMYSIYYIISLLNKGYHRKAFVFVLFTTTVLIIGFVSLFLINNANNREAIKITKKILASENNEYNIDIDNQLKLTLDNLKECSKDANFDLVHAIHSFGRYDVLVTCKKMRSFSVILRMGINKRLYVYGDIQKGAQDPRMSGQVN